MGWLERVMDGIDQIALHGVEVNRPPQSRGTRGLEDLAGEHREGDRERDLRWPLPGRGSGTAGPAPRLNRC